uniref:Transposase domain-containing protein n=1 Tax=Trichogramma kaykai TaxID=54128 RepID=A0ABD2XN02_9HYME
MPSTTTTSIETYDSFDELINACEDDPTTDKSCELVETITESDMLIDGDANFENENDDRSNSIDEISDSEYRFSDSEAESITFSDFDDETIMNENIFETSKNQAFLNDVTIWAKDHQITHTALRDLISILNKHADVDFPRDPRTILKTLKTTNVTKMDTGEYCHIGLKKSVEKMVMQGLFSDKNFRHLKLLINIDGAPLVGRSSEKGLWTILCKDISQKNVHLIGVYCGTKKPTNPNDLVEQFTNEAIELVNNGFMLNDKIFTVNIFGLILDAPAKAFILCTKYHSGYHSCPKCLIDGSYIHGVCFPASNSDMIKNYCHNLLRSDEEFKNFAYCDDYQKSKSILTKIPNLGLVTGVPIDAMHAAYIGVTKLLIRLWLGDKGRANKKYKLSAEQITLVGSRLEDFKHILPNDFNRRCRSITEWKNWKATEFRHFLLYLGPIVLKGVLKDDAYKNFLLLHLSMIILASPKLSKETDNVLYAENLIMEFNRTFQKTYGLGNVSYNVHCLIHIAKDVIKYGALESFSAFPFENYLSSIKKLIRKGEKPLQQIARRLSEYENSKFSKKNVHVRVSSTHFNGIVPDSHYNVQFQYKILHFDSWNIKIDDDRNNSVMLKSGMRINVKNIILFQNKLYVVGQKLIFVREVFEVSGFSSDNVGIAIVAESNDIDVWPCDDIYCKIFKIARTSDGCITYPIIHTLTN